MRWSCRVAACVVVLVLCVGLGPSTSVLEAACEPPPVPSAASPSSVSSGWFYELSWTATSPDDSYDIQESRDDPSFGAPSQFEDSGTSRYFSHSEAQDTHYYYRVRAKVTCDSGEVTSGWSNVTSTLVTAADCTDDVYEEDDDCLAARSAAVDSFESHRHCDPDWLSFDAIAGATYEILTRNLSGGADTVLQLKDKTCSNVLASDDDMGYEPYASRIEWTATGTAPLHVGVLEFVEYGDGKAYEVAIECLNGCPQATEPSFFSWIERQSCHGNRPALLIRWTPAPNADHYTVERLDGGYSATVDPSFDGLGHLVTEGLEYGRSYDFRVIAHHGATSSSSQIIAAYVVDQECLAVGDPGTPPGPFIAWLEPAVCTDGTPSVEIHWSQSGGADDYTLSRYTETGGTDRTVSGLQGTSYVDSVDIAPGLLHVYVLEASNAFGNRRARPSLDFHPPPDLCDATGLPGALVLSAGTPMCVDGEPTIPLSWTESSGAEYYSVKVLVHDQHIASRRLKNTFSTAMDIGLRPGAVHEIYVSAWSDAEPTVRRFSNSVYFDLAPDVCPVSPLPPTLYTLAPARVAGDSAILRSEVRANGSATSAHFEWGETTSYGHRTADVPVGSNSYWVLKPSVEITGLTCETQYHYRAVAQNVVGSSFGSDISFVTGACPSCGQQDLTLSDMTVDATATYEACNSITVGPNVTVVTGGDLQLAAPLVVLGDGFAVEAGGGFSAGPPAP